MTTGTKLNNAQRKAIAKVKAEQMADLIKEAKTALADRRCELLDKVKEEFGVSDSYAEIELHEVYIGNIKAKLKEIGLEIFKQGDVTPGGEVDLRLLELTGEYDKRVQELMQRKAEIAMDVWEAETTEELPDLPDLPDL